MKLRVTLSLLLGFISVTLHALEQKPVNYPKFEIANTQVIPIKDTHSDRQYELYIKLPKGYADKPEKQYPVIYMTDAKFHMEILSSATFFMFEEVILVGVSWQKDIDPSLKKEVGEYVSRFRDYSIKPSNKADRQAKYQFGGANKHLAFIRNDVFRFVEHNYRTLTDERTYFGFSLGGLFGTYALMTQPGLFKNYILGSPSIWEFGPYLFSLEAEELKNQKLALNLYVTYGQLEEELIPHIDQFLNDLKNKNYPSIASLNFQVIDASGHSDSFPIMGVKSIKWLSSQQNKGDKQ
ncbi:alpha/beta hydrolase [Aliikangiella marina]|uniref:Alpha/beta hydrolase n=1 Tax=Aliikangiella marina TaxID=1712262 RepID=A0A545TJ40_9GAMM|nr:alpha/beta hydrolase-fold protein [Aliikangiella marina]TQV77228.1 alpha/beta hydrolase [Aliikangiella marina]